MKRAVIDIGTNSVKLLIAEVEGHQVKPLSERSEQTRLGKGFYEDRRLQPEAMALTAKSVAGFVESARDQGIEQPLIIATSAAREALNQSQFKDSIREAVGLPVEIITGEQEAEFVFQGVTTDPRLDGKALCILDVGGGSTEFIVGERGHHVFQQSFDLGSVRLMEMLDPDDPPTLRDLTGCRHWLARYLNEHVGPAMESYVAECLRKQGVMVGTGGTTTILARMQLGITDYDRERIDGLELSRQQILGAMVQLWSQSLENRKKIVGLPPNRADIILMGVAIYEAVVSHFQCESIYVSMRGLRYGAALAP